MIEGLKTKIDSVVIHFSLLDIIIDDCLSSTRLNSN